MSYFDDASLVLIPSGYKDQKIFSVKPLDGSGDLAFSRASSATRVASNGLIEKVRTNVMTYSQDFSNANWVPFDASRTGSQTDPNGGTTASLYTSLTNSANLSANFATASSSPYTFSIYIKGTSSGSVSLRVDSGSTAAQNNISYTTSWQRFTYTFTAGASTSSFVLGGYASFTTGEGIYVAFAQAELGDIATDYIATTTTAVSVGPVSGLPRLDYLGSTCGKLLLEPQRTNVCLWSEDFSNAAWSKDALGTGTTPVITKNYTTSPDGTQNADRLQFSAIGKTSTSDYSLSGQYPMTLSATGTMTFYMKSLTSSNQNVLAYWGGGQGGVFVATTQWQRFTIANCAAGLANPAFGTRGGTGFTAGGDEVLDIAIWGVQVEEGSYATSYIPTLGTSVTRVADAASKTGISSLIGQTEGTLFGELTYTGIVPSMHLFSSVAGSYASAIYVENSSSNRISMQVWSGATQQVFIITGSYTVGQNIKFAAAYKNNDFVFYVNGTQIGTDTSGTVPSGLSQLEVGGYAEAGSPFNYSSSMKQAIVFPVRLSNSDLAALTA